MTPRLRSLLKIFGVIGSLLFARYSYYKIHRKYYKYPSGSIGLPLIGCLPQFFLKPSSFLLNIGKQYGPIATISFGFSTNIFINNAHLAREILKNPHTLNRSSSIHTSLRSSSSIILPFLNGKEWEIRRKYGASKLLTITSSSFISNSVSSTITKYVIPSIESCILSNNNINLWTQPSLYIEYITFNSIFLALFGCTIQLNINDSNNFFTKWRELINNLAIDKSATYFLDISGFKSFIPGWIVDNIILKKGKNCENSIDNLIIKWMENNGFVINNLNQTIKYGKNGNINSVSFCSEMIPEVNNPENKHYTLGSFIADLGSYLISGYHTTSNCAEYGFVLLAKNVDIQIQIHNELMSTSDDGLFRAFIYEMVRLSTILPLGLPHYASSDIKLNSKFNCVIPRGSSILINHFYIHKSNDNYWNNELDLNKWLDNNGKFKMNSNFVMFGYGRRDCIGKTLAIKQLYSMFKILIKTYKFTLSDTYMKNIRDNGIEQRWQSLLYVFPKIPLKVEKWDSNI